MHHPACADEVGEAQQLALVGPGIEDVGVHVRLDRVDVRQRLGRHDPAAVEVAAGLGRVGVEHVELGARHQVLLHDRRIVAGDGRVIDLARLFVVIAIDIVLHDVGLVLPPAEEDRLAALGFETALGERGAAHQHDCACDCDCRCTELHRLFSLFATDCIHGSATLDVAITATASRSRGSGRGEATIGKRRIHAQGPWTSDGRRGMMAGRDRGAGDAPGRRG